MSGELIQGSFPPPKPNGFERYRAILDQLRPNRPKTRTVTLFALALGGLRLSAVWRRTALKP